MDDIRYHDGLADGATERRRLERELSACQARLADTEKMREFSFKKRVELDGLLDLAHRKIEVMREALEFYADRDNWDDDKFNPTCWNDGNIDLGKTAKGCITTVDAMDKQGDEG